MKDYIVFSLSQNKKLARELAAKLNAKLGRISLTRFADGEVLVKTLSSVKGKDAIIIESTFKKAHERIFELLLLLDSVNRSGAKSIQLFIPYFGYSRQERVSWFNEPVSCEVVSNIIETANYDSLTTFDLHHPDIEKFFKRSIVDATTSDLFAEYYLNYMKENHLSKSEVVVVSPDHGANHRADSLVGRIGGTKVILDKVRPKANVAEHLVVDDRLIKNKVCIIIDDIIDTGGTIISAANLLYNHGAKKVLIGATHAVFSNHNIKKFKRANIVDIAVTNTIEQKLNKDIKILDICPLVMKLIK
ncbi:MAG TPA: ribose-phosphate diphosphokinase [Bacilli bacterium]|nr:ribose-phosphate diphosphokinase [Bacilli bacterium]HPS19147.1 ribose-phosphate diphosphokinase [Bacilli bacterium]